ncbi:MAG: hypothetical protein HOE30_04375 [Deltaproteobacteria bacterium]|nr:hypothetical protein [Deltaproteobacteria bacterium]
MVFLIKTSNVLMTTFILLLGLLGFAGQAKAQAEDYSVRIYYFYEVFNQIQLSDFALGSNETIKDTDGNGLGLSWVIKEGKNLKLELDLGYSRTKYTGSVEDGVEVTFEPQIGSGFDVLSQSTNVVYDFDIEFQNPFIGFNFVLNHFRFGGGRIFQSSTGGVTLYASNIEIATAKYVTKTQLYGQAGFEFNLDSLHFGFLLRAFEAPTLQIINCNEAALGQTVCQRVQGATGNRNLRSNAFGEGILQIGFLF